MTTFGDTLDGLGTPTADGEVATVADTVQQFVVLFGVIGALSGVSGFAMVSLWSIAGECQVSGRACVGVALILGSAGTCLCHGVIGVHAPFFSSVELKPPQGMNMMETRNNIVFRAATVAQSPNLQVHSSVLSKLCGGLGFSSQSCWTGWVWDYT